MGNAKKSRIDFLTGEQEKKLNHGPYYELTGNHKTQHLHFWITEKVVTIHTNPRWNEMTVNVFFDGRWELENAVEIHVGMPTDPDDAIQFSELFKEPKLCMNKSATSSSSGHWLNSLWQSARGLFRLSGGNST